jgi:hypothetical protein
MMSSESKFGIISPYRYADLQESCYNEAETQFWYFTRATLFENSSDNHRAAAQNYSMLEILRCQRLLKLGRPEKTELARKILRAHYFKIDEAEFKQLPREAVHHHVLKPETSKKFEEDLTRIEFIAHRNNRPLLVQEHEYCKSVIENGCHFIKNRIEELQEAEDRFGEKLMRQVWGSDRVTPLAEVRKWIDFAKNRKSALQREINRSKKHENRAERKPHSPTIKDIPAAMIIENPPRPNPKRPWDRRPKIH